MKILRVYEIKDKDPESYVVLIDRLWPRGIKKEKIDLWMREIAPSEELRKWYSHSPEKCDEFKRRYKKELESKVKDVDKLVNLSKEKNVIITYASKGNCTNANVLREFIEDLYGPEYFE